MEKFKIDYLKYNKKRGNFDNENLTLSGRSLETIVETCRDYSIILEEKAKIMNDDKARLKLSFELKAKECNEIADKIASEIGYCKDCGKERNKQQDDIGSDAMSLIINGYKR